MLGSAAGQAIHMHFMLGNAAGHTVYALHAMKVAIEHR
jgi:hypothetical protein